MILIFTVDRDEVMGERAFGPGAPRIIPDITTVGGQFGLVGDVADAERIVMPVAALRISVEIKGGMIRLCTAA